MADRSIVKIRDGKIVDTGKTRLPDGTIRVQPEGGIKFIPKTVKKAMGGEVMDTTKSMPADMMGGGKVRPMKMNMGGVVPGRGGKFKGVR